METDATLNRNGTNDLLLELALLLSGAERAFLVDWPDQTMPGRARVEAVRSRRADGRRDPSRALLHCIGDDQPSFICPDLRRDRRLSGRESVRSLDLRAVATFRFANLPGRQCGLVLDSRQAIDRGDALAALAELALAVVADPTERETTDRSAAPQAGPRSPAFVKMLAWLDRVAPTDLPVLIRGETGSGKELVARRIHRLGLRREKPFVAVNCAAVTESLLDAELFGSVRGAYTGAERNRAGLFLRADGGTIFLDEVGEMPASMQAKLLRVLQERRIRPVGGDEETPIDVRVLTASHRDLAGGTRSGWFRSDLYYRMAVTEVVVPPLRRRIEDLPWIVSGLATRIRHETGHPAPRLSDETWQLLRRHRWPGNVRELHSVLARAALCSGGDTIRPEHLVGFPPVDPDDQAWQGSASGDSSPPLERVMIERALRNCGSIVAAAQAIGWTRQKLYRRMKALGCPTVVRDRRSAHSPSRGTTSSDSSTFQ